MGIKLSAEQIQYIAMFENLTGATVMDCVVPEKGNRAVFVVKKGDISMAIGRGGFNVKKASSMIGRDIEVIEHADDPREFITRMVQPVRIQGIRIVDSGGRKTAYVSVHPHDRGIAIGREGATIQKVKLLSKRHHAIDDVVIV